MDIGRPPLLDEVKRKVICAMLAVGGTRAAAAQYVGCHPDTIRKTAERDEEFALAISHAESKHELLTLADINKAAKESRNWRAAAWLLERRYPSRYGRLRPEVITVEQISQALAQLADVLLDEVPEEQRRERILIRLTELTSQLHAAAVKGGRR